MMMMMEVVSVVLEIKEIYNARYVIVIVIITFLNCDTDNSFYI